MSTLRNTPIFVHYNFRPAMPRTILLVFAPLAISISSTDLSDSQTELIEYTNKSPIITVTVLKIIIIHKSHSRGIKGQENDILSK